MNITFKELRDIKHRLPTGSISRMAGDLHLQEQTIRNFFGAKKYDTGSIGKWDLQPGPDGGIMKIRDRTILDAAMKILEDNGSAQTIQRAVS